MEAYRCARCARDLGPDDIKRIRAGMGELLACAFCGDHVRVEASRVVKPIAGELATAFLYPFKPLPLVFSLGIALVAGLVAFLPSVGGLVAAGLRAGWLLAVLRAASNGQEDADMDPTGAPPSIGGWVLPAVRIGLAGLVASLPALLVRFALPEATSLLWLAGLAGLLYLPAALIVVSEDGSLLAALNPAPPIALIAQIPKSYFVACGLLLVLFAIAGIAMAIANAIAIPVLGFLLQRCVGFLPLVAAARLLGILVYEEREEL